MGIQDFTEKELKLNVALTALFEEPIATIHLVLEIATFIFK